MPYYTCRIAGEEGTLISYSILASSPEECRHYFESEGYLVLSVVRDWKTLQIQGRLFGKPVKDKDFILFNQELMALIKAGYPILKSLEVISARTKNIHLKELLLKIEADVRSGKALSEAFLPYEDRFTKVYTASLMAGERSGNLAETIGRYVQYAKIISQTKSRIRSALIYPTLLIVFSAILMGVLINFILPRFATFYRDFEAQMPAITTGLIAFALFARRTAVFFVLFFIFLFLVYARQRKKEKVQVAIDKIKLKIPFGRTIWRESGVSLFSRTLGLLLEAGLSLLSSVAIACRAVPNKFLVRNMKGLPDAIKNGQGLTESLAGTRVFPGLALDMIRIGENSANLQGMLADVADFYDERIRAKIDTLVSLIEPAVIILMGLIVAGMLLSVYLPIFNIIRIAR